MHRRDKGFYPHINLSLDKSQKNCKILPNNGHNFNLFTLPLQLESYVVIVVNIHHVIFQFVSLLRVRLMTLIVKAHKRYKRSPNILNIKKQDRSHQ